MRLRRRRRTPGQPSPRETRETRETLPLSYGREPWEVTDHELETGRIVYEHTAPVVGMVRVNERAVVTLDPLGDEAVTVEEIEQLARVLTEAAATARHALRVTTRSEA